PQRPQSKPFLCVLCELCGSSYRGSLPARLASSAAAAAAAATTSEAAAAAAAALRLRTVVVDGQPPPAHLLLIEFGSRLLRLLVGGHFDECKSVPASGCGIAHHADRFDRPCATEQFLQFSFAGRVRQFAHIQPTPHTLSSLLTVAAHRCAITG